MAWYLTHLELIIYSLGGLVSFITILVWRNNLIEKGKDIKEAEYTAASQKDATTAKKNYDELQKLDPNRIKSEFDGL